MKVITNLIILLLLVLVTVNFANAQTKSAKVINLLSGALKSNELPEGWSSSNCTQAKIQNSSMFLERDSPGNACVVNFNGQVPDGTYIVSANSYFDGYNPKIFLCEKDIGKKNEVTAVNSKINITIRVEGDGKVWGDIYSLTLTKKVISKPKPKTKRKK